MSKKAKAYSPEQLRTECHQITQGNGLSEFYEEANALCFAGKNLKNKAMYLKKKWEANFSGYLSLTDLDNTLRAESEYKALPAKVSQCVLRQLVQEEVSYNKAISAYYKNPTDFTGKPQKPTYKKKDSRITLTYNSQTLSKKQLKKGIIALSGSSIQVKTSLKSHQILEVRLVPKHNAYDLEIVYVAEKTVQPTSLNENLFLSIDLGLNNLLSAVLVEQQTNPTTPELKVLGSFLVDGKALKSINQHFNKKISKAQELLALCNNQVPALIEVNQGKLIFSSSEKVPQYTSHRLEKLWHKRANTIKAYLHKVSHDLVGVCSQLGVATIVIGENKQWKTDMNLGKKTNQHFAYIPFDMLKRQIEYKAKALGIHVVFQEESYTSKASALDSDPIPVFQSGVKNEVVFSGNRTSRGLYKTKQGFKIHADINGAINILRKYKVKETLCNKCNPRNSGKNAVPEGLMGVVRVNFDCCSRPVRVSVLPNESWLIEIKVKLSKKFQTKQTVVPSSTVFDR